MARNRARLALAVALGTILLASAPGDAAPGKPVRKPGVPVIVTFLAGSYASVDMGAGFRTVPLTGFAFGYVPGKRVDRRHDVPIVLLRAQAFPQATDLAFDTTCGELTSAARLDPATSVELTSKGGRATLKPDRTVTARASMAIGLKLDVRPPEGCGHPLTPTATATTVADFALKGTLGSSTGLTSVAMNARAKAYRLKACLTPADRASSTRCAGPVQRISVKIGLHLRLRIDLGVGGGSWTYPG